MSSDTEISELRELREDVARLERVIQALMSRAPVTYNKAGKLDVMPSPAGTWSYTPFEPVDCAQRYPFMHHYIGPDGQCVCKHWRGGT
jgi:hypothetical protein